MRTLKLSSGQAIPVLGMGTWQMGENTWNRQSEIDALRHGLDLGLSLGGFAGFTCNRLFSSTSFCIMLTASRADLVSSAAVGSSANTILG